MPTLVEIMSEAKAAAREAYEAATPTPMRVWTEDLDGNRKESWIVPEGMCGFAWVTAYVDGRSAIAKGLKALGFEKSYSGGLELWATKLVSDNGQSVERKEAACIAAAEVFRRYGIQAYAGSRLD